MVMRTVNKATQAAGIAMTRADQFQFQFQVNREGHACQRSEFIQKHIQLILYVQLCTGMSA